MRLIQVESRSHTEGRVASGSLGTVWINPDYVTMVRHVGNGDVQIMLQDRGIYVWDTLDEIVNKFNNEAEF